MSTGDEVALAVRKRIPYGTVSTADGDRVSIIR
jgi:hypothetical protein